MTPPNALALEERKKQLERKLSQTGQEHVLRWWPELTDAQKQGLLGQLEGIDLDTLPRLMRLVEGGASVSQDNPGPLVPPPCIGLPRSKSEAALEREAAAAGAKELRGGHVAVVTVAGGQGTRLRFDQPKGMYPISPVAKKTLFQLHAETLRALSRKFGAPVPWAIMTSDATDEATRDYFRQNNFLGLPSGDVYFFRQGMMPALDHQRQLVLTDKDRIFLSPNGHGGTIRALADEGVLGALLDLRGVRTLFYFQVDNPAVNIASPAFIGHHVMHKSEMSIKVMSRRNAEEKIGVMVLDARGKMRVIEYSDLGEKLKYVKYDVDEKGQLKFLMGSPAIHIFSARFIQRLAAQDGVQLPFHVAHKAVPYLDEEGRKVLPKEPNGYKFEMFIFDALPFAANPLLVEMDRAEEFAPVKNVDGEDSAVSCRQIMSEKHARWLQKAGASVPRDDRGCPRTVIEISSLYALDPDELAQRLPKGFKIAGEQLYLSQ